MNNYPIMSLDFIYDIQIATYGEGDGVEFSSSTIGEGYGIGLYSYSDRGDGFAAGESTNSNDRFLWL